MGVCNCGDRMVRCTVQAIITSEGRALCPKLADTPGTPHGTVRGVSVDEFFVHLLPGWTPVDQGTLRNVATGETISLENALAGGIATRPTVDRLRMWYHERHAP